MIRPVLVRTCFLLMTLLSTVCMTSCNKDNEGGEEYFSFEYNGQTWQADPSRFVCYHNEYGDYFNIIAEAGDGSTMLLNFSPVSNGPGTYDLGGSVNGNNTHAFFQPDTNNAVLEMISFENSLFETQADVMTITNIDRTNAEFNIVEGTFAFVLYPAYPQSNPIGPRNVTNGKFRLKFEFGSYHGPSL